MKKLLLFTMLVGFVNLTQAQTLNDVFSKYIQPRSSTAELKEGLQKIEDICSANQEEKCNKAKASAYYLIADDYYGATYDVYFVDAEIAKPILEKANYYYNLGMAIMPIEEFTDQQKRMMLDNKQKLESNNKYKTAERL